MVKHVGYGIRKKSCRKLVLSENICQKKKSSWKKAPSFIVYFFRSAFEIFGVAIFWVMRERGGIEGYNDFYSN